MGMELEICCEVIHVLKGIKTVCYRKELWSGEVEWTTVVDCGGKLKI